MPLDIWKLFKDTDHRNRVGIFPSQHQPGGSSVLPSSCGWWGGDPRAVTPLHSGRESAPEGGRTAASASARAATGCVWRGRAAVPGRPGPAGDTEKANKRLFCNSVIVISILKTEFDRVLIFHEKTRMRITRSKRLHGCFSRCFLLVYARKCLSSSQPREVGTDIIFVLHTSKLSSGRWKVSKRMSSPAPGSATFTTILNSLLA